MLRKLKEEKKSKQMIISEDLKYSQLSYHSSALEETSITKSDLRKWLLLAPEGQQIHLLLQHLGILVYCLSGFF